MSFKNLVKTIGYKIVKGDDENLENKTNGRKWCARNEKADTLEKSILYKV